MPIAISRFATLGNIADAALKRGDLKTIETLNQDEELRSANAQFLVRNKKIYVGQLKDTGSNHAEEQMESQPTHHPEDAQGS